MAAALTAAEAAVYDRQLRVWGLETQQKIRSSHVLIVGCTGLAAEVAKNIVLAGVGSVTLVDDTPCASRAPGNFLIASDTDPSLSVAEACVATLKDMNPHVNINYIHATPSTYISSSSIIEGYQLVLLTGQPGNIVQQADTVCTKANIPFVAGVCRGACGWAFANLHTHNYITEKKTEKDDGSVDTTIENHCIKGRAWDATSSTKGGKRRSPLLNVLKVVRRTEIEQQRAAIAADIPHLRNHLSSLLEEENFAVTEPESLSLDMYIERSLEMPAISAIVGGMIANDIIKVVSGKGEPTINNLFSYSLMDGAGWVETI